jgi:hypothetical protein
VQTADDGVDGGDDVCLNLAPVIAEGDDELGPQLANKGDQATRRPPVRGSVSSRRP